MTTDDPYLPLAFSLASSPGAYAVLAGAGISKGAGLPSAWDIVVDLVRQIAQRDKAAITINDTNAEQWYSDNYGKALTYSSVIEEVARTPHERQALLRGYFEPADEETQAIVPKPSPAHRAIAQLVEMGIIRVIVTMNFDRLFEQALAERGIQPTIVATEADAQGVGPLRLVQACVIHLHGDYLNPTSMLNTEAELRGYPPHMGQLLTHILGDYGLLAAGWSVTHDIALREAAAAHCTNRFSLGWIEPGQITDAARELIDTRSATVLSTTADDAFARLADQIIAIREKRARHPLTVQVAASRIKRQLDGQRPAISAHDMLADELTRLRQQPAFALTDYNGNDQGRFEQLLSQVIEASRVPAAAIAVLAYWGESTTDRWWTPDLQRFARPAPQSGSLWLINLPLVAASILFYSAGVASVAAQDYTRVARLFGLDGEPISSIGGPAPLMTMLAPNPGATGLSEPDHHDAVATVLTEALGVGGDVVDDAWQLFEIVRLAKQLMNDTDVAAAAVALASADRRAEATREHDPAAIATAAREKREILDQVAFRCHPTGLHLLAADKSYAAGAGRRWGSPSAERLAAEVNREGQLHPLVIAFDAEPVNIELALHAVSRAVGEAAEKHPANWVSGILPNEIWLDTNH
ncbi:SIR2 family protein [Mycobacterium sp. M1]|uniref:SIR2 family protein n=1 Tax=Mycolicibacter acidiphilus TaxID=2835306 RepID=A0ABS5REE3_9MYCO|nr:SIR2 family protein [Mycolicibacter acidiphilus]MBS9532559.1 SIR2 family protein [Mycolicibacter acidiphilus]